MARIIRNGYTLEIEKLPKIYDPSAGDIEIALMQIHPRTRSFFILSKPDGSYVQLAGARSRLMLEYRCVHENAFRHYVCGRHDDETREVSINYSCGPLRLQKNEVLTIRDAISVFREFLETGQTSGRFAWRDITSMFDNVS